MSEYTPEEVIALAAQRLQAWADRLTEEAAALATLEEYPQPEEVVIRQRRFCMGIEAAAALLEDPHASKAILSQKLAKPTQRTSPTLDDVENALQAR